MPAALFPRGRTRLPLYSTRTPEQLYSWNQLDSEYGYIPFERKLVLNREKHPIFDTTNCIQGTYVM